MTCMRCATPKACSNMGCAPGSFPPEVNAYQALLSDLEDWVERLERAVDLNEPRAVAADMRAALAAAGREVS